VPKGVYQRKEAAKRYQGSPCRKCGGTERFCSNGACTNCLKVRSETPEAKAAAKVRYKLTHQTPGYPRKRARERGDIRYYGTPCKKCSGTERWVCNGQCTACKQTLEAKAKQKQYNQSLNCKASVKSYKETARGRAAILHKGAKERAKDRGLPFTITIADVERLVVIAKKKWSDIGLDLDYTPGNKVKGKWKRKALTPSLDQIRAGEGYTPNNVQVVPWAWNALKGSHFSDAEAIEFCIKIAAARMSLTSVGRSEK